MNDFAGGSSRMEAVPETVDRGRAGGESIGNPQEEVGLFELAPVQRLPGSRQVLVEKSRPEATRDSRSGVRRPSVIAACERSTTSRMQAGVTGLGRKSMAPSFIAATASGMLPCAMTITTGTSLPAARSRRSTSIPSEARHPEVEQHQVGAVAAEQRPGPRAPSAASDTA